MKNRNIMNTVILCTIVSILITCTNSPNKIHSQQSDNVLYKKDSSYQWTRVIENAKWSKSYNFQMFSIKDTLWVFHSDGNWFSTNGMDWKKSPLKNSLNNLAFLDYVYFKGTMYGLGHFEGNIERHKLKTDIHITTDFKKWETITQNNLPKRFFYHPFVYQDKLWIIGGEDKNRKYSDIWTSVDGINWVKQQENLPFGFNDGGQFVVFNSKVYMFRSDVWSSSDGLNWEQVSSAIVPGEEIFGYAPVVFDDKIWLLGCNRNGQFTNQVLVSSDGKNWTGHDAPWTARGGVAATVHKGKIYMTGGKYGGTPNHPEFRYDNDLWTLEKVK